MAPLPFEIPRIDSRRDDLAETLRRLRERLNPQAEIVSEASRQRTMAVFGEPLTPSQVVERICGDVRRQGLPAVLRYVEQLDGVALTSDTVRVPAEELQQAHAQVEPRFLETIRRVSRRIRDFQSAIMHLDTEILDADGTLLRQRYLPLERVGICIPGGAAAYPSSVLMTVVPAQAAGVPQLAVIAPPTRFGAYNAQVLATCHELGVDEVYRVGGAQGVAALAYGVDGIPAVDKIVGPGNLFVALAKRHVFGHVDIDSIAGPSEVVIVADKTTPPAYLAADLLAQAEHAPGASLMVTWDAATLAATADELARQLPALERSQVTADSLRNFGALILVRDADEACDVVNAIAPEHLHLAVEDAESLLPQLRHAGAIFLGPCTTVALGDYVAGPSHVLPTAGTARWASGLTSNSFRRSSSIMRFTPDGVRSVAADVQLLAQAEQLTAHWRSVEVRLRDGR